MTSTLQQSPCDSRGTSYHSGLLVSFYRYNRVIPLEHHSRSGIITIVRKHIMQGNR